MAKKPDFTQKLLEDLRMRKDHMARSQNSNRSGQLVSERYRDFKHPYREAREIGSTTRDMQKWSGRSNRSLDLGETSKQLVPVGRRQSSEQIADLSMALAFAFQNGRDNRTRSTGNIMASYLNHLDKNGRSSGQFPTLSNLHITEISRGAQKLNQILKACYNGINFDVYSVDIGTELLKGALDLEESLKMLIDLQQASEYLVNPRRKQQKVRLLEMDDDGDESNAEVNKQKQIVPPRFSFDKPSGKPKNNTVKQKPLAITYHTEKPYLSSEKHTPNTSKLISHRRSASCGAEPSKSTSLSIIKKQSTSASCGAEPSKSTSLSIIKKQSTPTESRSERGRIPNVIAKLMGLEELPPNKESNVPPHKEPHVKHGERDRNLQRRGRKGEHPSIDLKKPAQRLSTQKLEQPEKLCTAPDNTSLVVYVGKMAQNLPEIEFAGEKVHLDRRKTESGRLMSNSSKPTVRNPEINMAQQRPVKQSLMDKLEKKREQENVILQKQIKKRREEANEAVLKDVLKEEDLETANGKTERIGTRKDALSKETKTANKLLMAYNHEKPLNPTHPVKTFRKPTTQDAKLQANNRDQKKAANHLQARSNDWKSSQQKLLLINQEVSQKKTETSGTVPSGRSAEYSSKEGIAREENPKTKRAPNQILAEQRPTKRDSKAENVTAPATQVVASKPLHVPLAEKVYNIEAQGSVSPRGTKEGTIRENDFASKLLKVQASTAEVPKDSPKSKVGTSKEENGSKEAGTQDPQLNSTPQIDADCTSIVSKPIGEVYPRLNGFSSNNTIQDSITTVSDFPETSAISPIEHQIPDSTRTPVSSTVSPTEEFPTLSDTVSIPIKGYHEDIMLGVSKSFREEPHKHLEPYTPEQLTDEEKHLKEILVHSQMFLNAAEALFGLLIPVEMLQYSDNKYSDHNNKLALDCAYEVMKRKGRRHEFMFHPWANMRPGTYRIKCLDDLVKDLHGDLKTLDTEHASDEHDDAANRQREMIQKDLQNNKPDVNCMWDLEWGAGIFAYTEKEEVAKDIEKHVLNRLLDEFTRETLQLTTVA